MDHSQLVGQSRSILGLMHAYRSLPELSKPARIKKPDLNVVVRSWAVSVEASKPNAAADFVVPKAHAFWSPPEIEYEQSAAIHGIPAAFLDAHHVPPRQP